MWFNSFLFLLFLTVVLCVYPAIPGWRAKKRFLLACSYLFYACWSPPFLLLLIASSTIDYTVGRALGRQSDEHLRRLLVAVSCSTNLGILAFFKYARFLIDSYDSLVQGLGLSLLSLTPPAWISSIVLPIGISFYTFHGLSYIVDVYNGRKTPVEDWVDFYLFVAFFPQLVAGPILRATQFMPQLVSPRRVTLEDWATGGERIMIGLFQKMVMADNIAPLANLVFDRPQAFTGAQQWVGVYAFAMQIYFDFAGYSNIAIGTARLLGFRIPENFNLPYLAVGFREFWRRWHISLSTWLRDYLYIPLGGSRDGPWATRRNLLITMFLGGLWHGATWSFAVWGVLHGLFLTVEHAAAGLFDRLPPRVRENPLMQLLGMAVTFHLTCLAWVFFRLSTSITDAIGMCASLLKAGGWTMPASGFERIVYVQLGFLGYLIAWLHARRTAGASTSIPGWARAVAAAIMLYLVITGWGSSNEFIYFQF